MATASDLVLAAVVALPATIAAIASIGAKREASIAKAEATAAHHTAKRVDDAVNGRLPGTATISDDVTELRRRGPDVGPIV